MNISEYAVVNLAGFADIIDAIGGIEMDVTYDEMKHVNNILGYYREDAKQNGAYKGKDFSDLETYGENTHLTGQQALAYSRIRKLDTEYKRTERQREVLTAIGNKLSKQSTFDLFGTALQSCALIVESILATLSHILQVYLEVVQAATGCRDVQLSLIHISEPTRPY